MSCSYESHLIVGIYYFQYRKMTRYRSFFNRARLNVIKEREGHGALFLQGWNEVYGAQERASGHHCRKCCLALVYRQHYFR